MPHTRSARKQHRKSERRRLQNRATIKALKTQIKKVYAAAEEGQAELLRTQYNVTAKRLDQAAAKRVIHPNMAARKKSQLARLLNKTASAPKT